MRGTHLPYPQFRLLSPPSCAIQDRIPDLVLLARSVGALASPAPATSIHETGLYGNYHHLFYPWDDRNRIWATNLQFFSNPSLDLLIPVTINLREVHDKSLISKVMGWTPTSNKLIATFPKFVVALRSRHRKGEHVIYACVLFKFEY